MGPGNPRECTDEWLRYDTCLKRPSSCPQFFWYSSWTLTVCISLGIVSGDGGNPAGLVDTRLIVGLGHRCAYGIGVSSLRCCSSEHLDAEVAMGVFILLLWTRCYRSTPRPWSAFSSCSFSVGTLPELGWTKMDVDSAAASWRSGQAAWPFVRFFLVLEFHTQPAACTQGAYPHIHSPLLVRYALLAGTCGHGREETQLCFFSTAPRSFSKIGEAALETSSIERSCETGTRRCSRRVPAREGEKAQLKLLQDRESGDAR